MYWLSIVKYQIILKLNGVKQEQTFIIFIVYVRHEFQSSLARRFWFKVSHRVTSKMSAGAVDIQRLN